MSRIEYRDTHDFDKEELRNLFLSVEWESGNYPDKLVIAMKNYKTVYSAWDKDKLVGLICAMDDGIMTAYVHYLLVNPNYQGMNIGRNLVEKIKNQYKEYMKIALIGEHTAVGFYIKCGFKECIDASPMYVIHY